jgi:hypothetical protein
VSTVSNTAGAVSSAYTQAKSAVAQGQQYYEIGKSWFDRAKSSLSKAAAYAAPLKPWWELISGHNNPKRVLIIVGILLAVLILFKLRHRRYRKFYDR